MSFSVVTAVSVGGWLTFGSRRKFENHLQMVPLYTVWYNFVKLHKTLKMTPALGAGVSNLLWSMEDVVALIDAREASRRKRDPYKFSNQAAA